MRPSTVPLAVGAALACLGVVLELAYGTPLLDVLRYAGYELAFVLLPGVLAVRALRPSAWITLPTFALGWALGYVLEVIAFNLTAAAGARGLFLVYPVVVIAAAVGWIRRSRREGEPPVRGPRLTSRELIAVGGVCALTMLYVGLPLFSETRLPGSGSVNYNQDYAWAISLAADLKHHWPLADPNVSGEGLPYHFFFNAHVAAASQVTGIDVPTIFLRLFAIPMAACLALQLVMAGLVLFRSAAVGVLASGLSLLVGQMQLDARTAFLYHVPFFGVYFIYLLSSPSFFFGLLFFVPLAVLVGEGIANERSRPSVPALVLLGLFIVGASDAKVTILPGVIVSLGIFGLWCLLKRRPIPAVVSFGGAMAVVTVGLLYLVQYRGHSNGIAFDLTSGYDVVNDMPAIRLIKDGIESASPHFPGDSVLSLIAYPLGLAGLLAPQLIGIWFVLRGRAGAVEPVHVWLLSLLASGLLAFLFVADLGQGTQLYFLFYSVTAGSILAAVGWHAAWKTRPEALRGDRLRRTVLPVAGAICLLIAAPFVIGLDDGDDPDRYVLLYLGFAALLGLSYVVLRRRAGGGTAALVVAAAVVAVGMIGAPVDRIVPALTDRAAESDERTGLTPGLHDGLAWVRDETPTDSVIAVDAPGIFAFSYAAFAERRTFLGGWGYSQRSRDDGFQEVAAGTSNPFADRLALNAAAFSADPGAVKAMRADHDVRYLIVDLVNGPPVVLESLSQLGEPVYENDDVLVIDLAPA